MKPTIRPLKDYPDNGKHLQCVLGNLPFEIRKGADGYYYMVDDEEYSYNLDGNDQRWIVHLNLFANESLRSIFKVQVNESLDIIVDYCIEIYKKSLELEIKRLKKELKELV